jgi:hypothetical protein
MGDIFIFTQALREIVKSCSKSTQLIAYVIDRKSPFRKHAFKMAFAQTLFVDAFAGLNLS